MKAAESAGLVELAARSGRRQRRQLQHPLLPAQPARARARRLRRARRRPARDRPLPPGLAALETDWNWRLEPDKGGSLRAVGDIGSHWLDLMTFLTGQRVDRGHGRPRDVHPSRASSRRVRSRPSPRSAARDTVERARSRPRTPRRSCCASRTARAARWPSRRSARAARTRCAGRSTDRAAPRPGTPRQPDQLWLGHRERPNEILLRESGAHERRRQRLPRPARRACRGLRRHVRRPLPGRSTPTSSPAARPRGRLRHVRRRPRRDARRRRDRRERPRRAAGSTSTARPRRAAAPGAETHAMRLGFLTAPFPDTPLDGGRRLGGRQRASRCSRSRAGRRPTGPTRRYAGTSHIDVANLSRRPGAGHPRRDRGARASRSRASASTRTRSIPTRRIATTVIAHLRHVIDGGREDGRPAREHVHGRRRGEEPGRELGGGAPRLAGHRRASRRTTAARSPSRTARCCSSYDEWPGGHNIATTPRDVAADPRAVGRHDRAQLRPDRT